MKIKRYMAASMRVALDQVRIEQGPDAVILSSRRVEEGIEVIAAVDYDEALFVDARQPRASAPAHTAPADVVPVTLTDEVDAPDVVPRRAAPQAVTPGRVAPPATPAARLRRAERAVSPEGAPPPVDEGYLAMQGELKAMRSMLEGGLKHMSWSDKRVREPLQSRVLEELTAMNFAADVAQQLASLTPAHTSLDNAAHIPLAMLVRHLPVVDQLTTVNPGIIALVGPTGAGKTTTIAKLAARWAMQHGSQDLALVSTDSYRIGAREQLASYARIIGAPMHTANSGRELAQVLGRLKSKQLVLIDTAGMGPRDVRLSEQLSALQLGAARARVLLALPAQGEANALEDIVRAFERVTPQACILTKVDEASSLGAVLSVTLRHTLKIAYLCTGQRVPEDLHPAHQQKVWLARRALTLKQQAVPRADEAYLARNFGGAGLHA